MDEKRRLSGRDVRELRIAYTVYYVALALYVGVVFFQGALDPGSRQAAMLLAMALWLASYVRLMGMRRAHGLSTLGDVEAVVRGREPGGDERSMSPWQRYVHRMGVAGAVTMAVLAAILCSYLFG